MSDVDNRTMPGRTLEGGTGETPVLQDSCQAGRAAEQGTGQTPVLQDSCQAGRVAEGGTGETPVLQDSCQAGRAAEGGTGQTPVLRGSGQADPPAEQGTGETPVLRDSCQAGRVAEGGTGQTPTSPQGGVDLDAVESWPYPKQEYPLRVLWALIWATVWKLCWKRLAGLRTGILRMLGAKIAGPAHIAGSAHVQRPWDLVMGRRCALGPRVRLYNLGHLEIGDQVVISQDAYICGGTHDYTDPTYPLIRTTIRIGSNAWIAAGAFIGPGVTIGEGAVVGARAVVVNDVPPWTVVAGHPARVIKKREMKKKDEA